MLSQPSFSKKVSIKRRRLENADTNGSAISARLLGPVIPSSSSTSVRKISDADSILSSFPKMTDYQKV